MTDSTAAHPVRSWLGVPFATAERLRRPVLLPFDPELPHDRTGPAPVQAGDTSWLEAEGGFSEQCLNLNVWAPADAGDGPLPVVVYVFGGGFALGANTQTTSDASGLAATGRVIGVSVNYRLGPFGWLSLSQYGGALAEASNLGLQDVVTALRWVRANIARFGGDPDDVTVAGHSAGAFTALGLLSAPDADGLYHHLAAFSGGASRIVPAWWAEDLALRFLTALGIQDDPEQVLHLDGKLLADTLAAVSPPGVDGRHGVDNTTIAVVDDSAQPGGVLTGPPLRVLEAGTHRDVDVLLSSTTQETQVWVANETPGFDPGSIETLVTEFAGANRIPLSRARRIVAHHETDGRRPIDVRAALLTDWSFTLPAVRAALAHAAAGGDAHLLCIGAVPGAPAVHGTEMYGIVGQTRPGASDEHHHRDTAVRDAVLALATGRLDEMWPAVTDRPTTRGLGDQPDDPTTRAVEVLQLFEGIERP